VGRIPCRLCGGLSPQQEDLLATLFQIQLNARYGIPVVAKSLLTGAEEPDAQAAAEK